MSLADRGAIERIWVMSEADVRANHPNLTGEAFWDRVEAHWVEMVEATQPMSDRDIQGHIIAGRKGITKALMFYGQRTQMINELIQRYDDYQQAPDDVARVALSRRLAFSSTQILLPTLPLWPSSQ